ncbi:hypothetical protein AeNC1_006197 [Aphanomyces euteiches]|nr:hypothetical protein AeNC1_006197 [Aphanomyces euteiches]
MSLPLWLLGLNMRDDVSESMLVSRRVYGRCVHVQRWLHWRRLQRCFDARTNDNDTSSNDTSSNHNVHADNISYYVVANANADTESDNAILWSDSNDISSTDASANQLVNVVLVVEFVARFKSAKRRAHSFTFLFFLNSSNRVHTKATDIFSWELNELKRHNDHDAAPDDGNTRICRPNDCNTRNDGGTSDDIARADKERRPHTA